MSTPLILSHNENSYGCSPNVLKALQSTTSVHRYPEVSATSLKKKLASTFSLNVEQIVCGHGSEELLYKAVQLFSQPGNEILIHQHSFHIYAHAAKLARAKTVFLPQPTLQFNVDTILQHVTTDTKIIIIDNPANPLGCLLTKTEILRLVSQLPGTILLILDEAYAEFVTEPGYASGLDLVNKYPHIMVTRTFSKIYGLAGLRLGWGYASPAIAATMIKNLSPFNINTSALNGGIVALEDQEWVKNVRQQVIQQRQKLSDFFKKHQIEHLPSQGNFILFKPANMRLFSYLQIHKIHLRSGHMWGLPDYLRITVGNALEMEQFYQCYENWQAAIAA